MARGAGKPAKKLEPAPAARRRDPRTVRVATAADLGLTAGEYRILARLDTPPRIQAFLNAIPANHEFGGETVLCAREVLRQRRAHCIEGAMVAAAAMWANGIPPLLMHLDCHISDYPHVIAVFRQRGHWGAISKTNGAPLRYRDPVYRSLRELALSYFHEYLNKRGMKTLRSYSRPIDMRTIPVDEWVVSGKDCWKTHDRITALRHYPLISAGQEKLLVKLDRFARGALKAVEHPRPERPQRPGR